MSSNYSRSPEDDFFHALDASLTNEYSSQKMSNFINDLLAAINNLDDDPDDGFGFSDEESDYWSNLDNFTGNHYSEPYQRRLRKNRTTFESHAHDASVDMFADEQPSKREASNASVSIDMFDDESVHKTETGAHDMSLDLFDDEESAPRAKAASISEKETGDVSADMFSEFENDVEVMDAESICSDDLKSNEHSEVVDEERITDMNRQRIGGSTKNESKTIIEVGTASIRNVSASHSFDVLVCVPSNISAPSEDEKTVIVELQPSPLRSRMVQQSSGNGPENVPEILSQDIERGILRSVDERPITSLQSSRQSSVFREFSPVAPLVQPLQLQRRMVQQSSRDVSSAPENLPANEHLRPGDERANTSTRSSCQSSVFRGFSPVAPLVEQPICASTKDDSDLNTTLCEEYEFSNNFVPRRSFSRSPIFHGFSPATSPMGRTSQRQNSIRNLSRSEANLSTTFCEDYETGRLLALYQNATESINLEEAYTQCFSESQNQEVANASDRRQSFLVEIEKLVLTIQNDLVNGRKLSVAVPYRLTWDNCVVNDERLFLRPLSNGATRVIKSNRKIALIVYVLSFVYKLLINNETCTRRQIYYSDPEFTQSKIQIDDTIMDVCFLLNAPPWEIGILSSSKGLIAGSIKLTLKDDTILDVESVDGGILLPHQTMTIKKVETDAKFVLLVEKHTIYEKLLLENVLSRLGPCILITGKGFPDINTRAILKRIWDDCKCPIYALVDADPFGVEIMLSYRHGSQRMSFFNENLAIPSIRWIGVFPSEIEKFNLQSLALTQADVSRVDSLMNRPYLRKGIYKELLVMKKTMKKAEVEALMSSGIVDWIESYLLHKIQNCGSV